MNLGSIELLAKKGDIDANQEQVLKCYNKGYSLYRVRKWNEAAEWFEKALTFNEGDRPSLTFFERCITFQIHPPREDWDGVFSLGVK